MIMVCTYLLCVAHRAKQSDRLMDDDQLPTPEMYVRCPNGVLPGRTLTTEMRLGITSDHTD